MCKWKRRHIGRLIAAYALGVKDARRARYANAVGQDDGERKAYLLGQHDERRRMHMHKKLPQLELELDPGDGLK